MAAVGKLAWFLVLVSLSVLVDSQVVRPYVASGGRSGFRGLNRLSPTPGLTRGRFLRPVMQSRQQPRRRTTVLQQTVVVNDNTNIVPKSHQNQRPTGRSGGQSRFPGTGNVLRSSSRRRRPMGTVPRSSSRSIPGRVSFGGRVPLGSGVGRPSVHGRNPSRVLSHNNLLQSARRPSQTLIGNNLGHSRGNFRGRHPIANRGNIGHGGILQLGGASGRNLHPQLGGLRLSGNSGVGSGNGLLAALGIGPGTGAVAIGARGHSGTGSGSAPGLHTRNNLHNGNTLQLGGVPGAGSVTGVLAALGMGTGAGTTANRAHVNAGRSSGSRTGLNTGTGLLAAGLGLGPDLMELTNALSSVFGQSNGQTNAINSLLPGALPSVPQSSMSTQPGGARPVTASSSFNPQALLGRLLGDNRREGVLQGDANERIIERLKVSNPELLPPDV